MEACFEEIPFVSIKPIMVTEFLILQLLAECFILYSLQQETVNREQTFIVGLKVQLSGVTMTYETKSSGNIIKTLEINDLSQITCYYSSKLIPLSSHRKGGCPNVGQYLSFSVLQHIDLIWPTFNFLFVLVEWFVSNANILMFVQIKVFIKLSPHLRKFWKSF